MDTEQVNYEKSTVVLEDNSTKQTTGVMLCAAFVQWYMKCYILVKHMA